MKQFMRKFVVEHSASVLDISGAMAVGLLFLCGLGSFRVVLVYVIYCLVNSLKHISEKAKNLPYFLLPLTLAALYLDVTKGPLFPKNIINSVVVAMSLMIVVDYFVRYSISRCIEVFSGGNLFQVCPGCKYDNKELISTCHNCSFKCGEQVEESQNLHEMTNTLPAKVLHMTGLRECSSLLFYLRIFPFRSVVKNGERQIRTYFLLTTKDVIFLDYFFFAKSWREKDVVPLKNIISVKQIRKKFQLIEEPCLEITTSNKDVYEIFFKKFDRYNKYCEKITEVINAQK